MFYYSPSLVGFYSVAILLDSSVQLCLLTHLLRSFASLIALQFLLLVVYDALSLVDAASCSRVDH